MHNEQCLSIQIWLRNTQGSWKNLTPQKTNKEISSRYTNDTLCKLCLKTSFWDLRNFFFFYAMPLKCIYAWTLSLDKSKIIINKRVKQIVNKFVSFCCILFCSLKEIIKMLNAVLCNWQTKIKTFRVVFVQQFSVCELVPR